jgi:hypothetical protein
MEQFQLFAFSILGQCEQKTLQPVKFLRLLAPPAVWWRVNRVFGVPAACVWGRT